MVMPQFPNEAARIAAAQAAQQVAPQDPSVWARFLGPAARGVSTGLETLNAPFEFVKQQALAPIVEGLTQSLPVRWQPGPGAFNFDMNFDAWVTPEGKFSPSAALHNVATTLLPPVAAIETKAMDPIFAAPGTRRYQNIQQEIARREQKFGRPLSEMEIRQTGEELYKLPPFMRGTLEELPYLFIPPAGAVRAGSAAARAGKMLRPAGQLAKGVEGPVQPAGTLARQAPGVAAAARGALKAGEVALKPLDVAERATMKAISFPFRKGAAGVVAATKGYTDWGDLKNFGKLQQEFANTRIKEGTSPEESLQIANQQFTGATGVNNRFALNQLDEVVQNPDVQLPSGTRLSEEAQRTLDGVEVPSTAAGERAELPVESNIPQTLEPKISKEPIVRIIDKGLESGKWLKPTVMAKQTTNQMLDTFAKLSTHISGKVPYIQRMNTGRAADDYVGFMNKYHDGQFLLRNFQDNFWRSNKVVPGQIFSPGEQFDVVTKMRLAMGAKQKGLIFYANFLKNSLEPAVAKGIDRFDIDRYLFAKRAQYLYKNNRAWNQLDETQNRGPLRFLDYETDPVTKKLLREEGVVVDDVMAKQWTDFSEGSALRTKYTQEQIEAFQDVVTDARDMMRMSRRRQFENKVIPQEMFEFYDMVDDEIAELAAGRSSQIRQLWNDYQVATNVERRALTGRSASDEVNEYVDKVMDRAGVLEADRVTARNQLAELAKEYNSIMAGFKQSPRGRTVNEPWYMPMAYINAAETKSALLGSGTRGLPRLSKAAWEDFVEIPGEDVMGREAVIGFTAKPMTGDTMLKHLMADEIRAAENDLLNDLFDMGLFAEHGLVDISKNYITTSVDERHIFDVMSDMNIIAGRSVVGVDDIQKQLKIDGLTLSKKSIRDTVNYMTKEKVLTKQQGKNRWMITEGAKRPVARDITEESLPSYDPNMKSGVITFFRNGERKVFAATEAGGAVDPVLWNTIYGRGGLAVRGGGSRGLGLKLLAMSNGFFRGALTTYNPLFIVKNMLIDMFTGTMAGGAMIPYESMARLVKSAKATAFDQEDRFTQIYMGGGGLQGRIFDPTPDKYRRVTKAIEDARHDGVVVQGEKQIDRALKDAAKEMMGVQNRTFARKMVGGLRVWKTVPATGALAEQSVRYAVAKRSFKNQLETKLGKAEGKKEWKRLMKMDERQWNHELFDNWNNTGRGLIDSAEAKAASITGVQSTLDFQRGGDMVREINSYVLFLNAAMEGMKQPFRLMGLKALPKVKMREYQVDDATGLITEGPFKGLRVSDESVPKYQFLEPGEGRWGGVTSQALETGTGGPKQVALRLGVAMSGYVALQQWWNMQWEYQGIPLYYDVPEYVRNNAIVVMLPPPKDENGDYIMDVNTERPKLRYIVIPHNLREWNMLFQPANYLMDEIDNDVPRDFKTFWYDLYRNQSPVGDGIPLPEFARYSWEIGTGEDLFRGEDIVGTALKGELPPDQYDTRSSEAVIQLAQSVYDSDLPDWIKNKISSPKRAEHFFTGATGGIGKEALTTADFILDQLNTFREEEARPMEERIEEYRQMDRISKEEFVANLNAEDLKAFRKEIRRPRKQMPFFTKLINIYSPGAGYEDPDASWSARGGGIRQAARRMTEEEFPEISTQETRDAGIMSRKVNDQLRIEQQKLDTDLDKWNTKNTTGIDPTAWIEGRKAKKHMQKGVLMALGEMYPGSIYAADDATRDAFYETLYTAVGTDTRNASQLLIAAYYAIEPEGDHPEAEDWAKFYATRDEFMLKLRTSSESNGDKIYENFLRDLQSNMTDMERSYDNARRYLSTYWNLGKDVSQLTSNPSARLQEQWDEYNNLPNMAQKDTFAKANPHIDQLRTVRTTLRKMLIKQDLDRSGAANLDSILVYWYGGKGWHKGYTDEGKAYWNRLYGTTATGIIPRNPMTEN